MEFFESVELSGNGTITNTADIPINTNNSKEVIVQSYSLPKFNIKILTNITGLHLPDEMKFKGEENY